MSRLRASTRELRQYLSKRRRQRRIAGLTAAI